MPEPQTLHEFHSDWNETAERALDTRELKNIALAGAHSRNGYTYSEAALQAAASLYDGKQVFLDHATDTRTPRSTRDLAGTISLSRYSDGRIRANIQTIDNDSGRTLMALAEHNAPGVGMSQVVTARKSTDGQIIEHIEAVHSVDVVIGPATVDNFQEQTGDEPDPLRESIEQLRTDLADIRAQLAKPTSTGRRSTHQEQTATDDQYIRALRAA